MRAYVVTGTTRGIGRSLAEVILAEGHHLFSLSSAADQFQERRHNLQCDLSRSNQVVEKLARLLAPAADLNPEALVLINNAAVLAPMGPIETAPADRMVHHLQVNLAAPALLMSGFIDLTAPLNRCRRIINISSGAARHPYAGWSLYCAAKAGLDMMSRCVAAEQADRPNPVAVAVVHPGKVDTEMQTMIRRSDPSQFPSHAAFVKAKQRGDLLSAGQVARLIVALDGQERFQNGGVYDLRDARLDADGGVAGLKTR